MAMEALATAVRHHARLRVDVQIALAFATLSLCSLAATARASSRPVQGVYEYCAPAASRDGCVGRLQEIAAGGFRVVVNYAAFDADAAQVRHYIAAAARLRLKLIWPMKDSPWWGWADPKSLALAYPELARDCRCADATSLLRYVVTLVSRSSATWGYYIADEQSPRNAGQVTAFSGRLRALDPYHPRLAVAAGEDSVAQLLAPFAPAADVLGADSYPVGAGQSLDRVGAIGRAIDAVTRAHHRRSAIVLQAFDWSDYPGVGMRTSPRWPTRTEMRRMRETAIAAAHPALILWYSYFDVRGADAGAHWRDLVWAAGST
jgi:hypothetical protein